MSTVHWEIVPVTYLRDTSTATRKRKRPTPFGMDHNTYNI